MGDEKKKKAVLRPVWDRIICTVEEASNVSKGGVHLPETRRDFNPVQIAKVISVGPGKWDFAAGERIPLTVKPGDRIIIPWGSTVELDGEEYRVVKEPEVYAILD